MNYKKTIWQSFATAKSKKQSQNHTFTGIHAPLTISHGPNVTVLVDANFVGGIDCDFHPHSLAGASFPCKRNTLLTRTCERRNCAPI